MVVVVLVLGARCVESSGMSRYRSNQAFGSRIVDVESRLDRRRIRRGGLCLECHTNPTSVVGLTITSRKHFNGHVTYSGSETPKWRIMITLHVSMIPKQRSSHVACWHVLKLGQKGSRREALDWVECLAGIARGLIVPVFAIRDKLVETPVLHSGESMTRPLISLSFNESAIASLCG